MLNPWPWGHHPAGAGGTCHIARRGQKQLPLSFQPLNVWQHNCVGENSAPNGAGVRENAHGREVRHAARL